MPNNSAQFPPCSLLRASPSELREIELQDAWLITVRPNVKTKAAGCVTLIASIVGIAIGKIGVQSYFDHRRATAFERALIQTSTRMNAKLPIQVDRYTRLDTTVPGPGKRLTYFYTISDVSGEQVDPAEVITALRPSIVNGYKTSPQFASFREQGVEMHYVYRDADGRHLGEIAVSPKDF